MACCGLPGPPVKLVYLGVGGWLVHRGGLVILFAPLFSNPSLTRAGFSRIVPDTVRIEHALDSLAVDLSEVSLILSGHGHYDHLMDVPYVMPRARACSRTAPRRTRSPPGGWLTGSQWSTTAPVIGRAPDAGSGSATSA